MKNIAIIDIGSNSIKIIIYKILKNNLFKAVETEKYPTKLGSHLDEKGNLSSEGIDLTLNTLKIFKNICEINHVSDTYVFATEAIRKSKNSSEFLPLIKKETGLDIKILSGFDEAFLGYCSVKSTFDINDALIVDLGGSSMEISLMRDKKILNSISLPLGVILLTKKFNFYENISSEQRHILEEFLFTKFSEIPWLKECLNLPIVGISSASRTIAKVYMKNIDYPLDILHNFQMPLNTINHMYTTLAPLSLDEKKQIKGLGVEKADIFTSSLGIISSLMKYCSSDKLIISQFGIKEGMLFNILNADESSIANVLDYSINNIIFNEDFDKRYENKILNFSINFCKKLDCNLLNEKILRVTSYLSNIGSNISLENIHKHSFYKIINSNFYGLKPKEILMCAYIIALTKKENFKLKSKYRQLLPEDDILYCKKISIILSLAKKIISLNINPSYNIYINEDINTIVLDCSLDLTNKDFIKKIIENNINAQFYKYFNKDISIIV